MNIHIRGIGVRMRGARDWDEFCSLAAAGGDGAGAEWQPPAPDAIPARERRRAPLMVKLAVDVAYQACNMAGVESQSVATVFSSAMGDTEITDYMCRTLAGESKVLSPTRFHNSVHNAPAGYWSISAGNREPSSSVACSRESFSVALLEAGALSVAEQRPVLMIASDVSVPGPLGGVYPIEEPFGAALLLDASAAGDEMWDVSVANLADRAAWPKCDHPFFQSISERNPSARSLALLEAIARETRQQMQWPLNDSACLQMVRAATVGTRNTR